MVETVLAVLIVAFVFAALFSLSRLLMGRIILDYASMRVARARTVGYNDFICRKAARVAAIPISGKQLVRPVEAGDELSAAKIYLLTKDSARARGLLHYERWDDLSVEPLEGDPSKVRMKSSVFDLTGEAKIENNYRHYMYEGGR